MRENIFLLRSFLSCYPLVWLFVVWNLLPFITGSTATLSVVLSGSMEPSIKRGDLLFAIGPYDLKIGDIVLYNLPHRDVAIVHRVIEVKETHYILTKGDANPVDDRGLYWPSYKHYLPKEAVIGKVRGVIPWIGFLSLWLQPFRSYVIIGVVLWMIFAEWRNSKSIAKHDDVPSGRWAWLKFLVCPLLSKWG